MCNKRPSEDVDKPLMGMRRFMVGTKRPSVDANKPLRVMRRFIMGKKKDPV